MICYGCKVDKEPQEHMHKPGAVQPWNQVCRQCADEAMQEIRTFVWQMGIPMVRPKVVRVEVK